MAYICIVTSAQPAMNPRMVKEADALTGAGHEVHVLAAHVLTWASAAEPELLASRPWTCTYVGGTPSDRRLQYWSTRMRQALTKRALPVARQVEAVAERSLARVGPELERTARRLPADLYIGHNLAALPVVVRAATARGVPSGYDAEDFLSGMRLHDVESSPTDRVIESIERRYLPRCAYVTAASPGIAQAYAKSTGIPTPEIVLNTFPLAERPATFRQSPMSGPLTLYWFSQTIGANRGLEDVVRAMGVLADRPIELHLRGGWQGGYQQKLAAVADEAGVPRERIFVHDHASPSQMVRLAAQYDVGLAVEPPISRHIDVAISNKLFTYLLAGNAIAATSTTGQQTVMEAVGPAGFTYKPYTFHDLAERLAMWSDDRNEVERARRAAWEWGTRRYNWDIEKLRLIDVVERTLRAAQ